MKCSIVKELLSNYADGLTSEETAGDIRKHLAECENCRRVYEHLRAAVSRDIPPEEKDIDPLIKLKKKIRHRIIAAAVSTCVILTGLILFAMIYEFPLPFDSNRMFVEPVQAVFGVVEDGSTFMKTLDDLTFEQTNDFLEGKYEQTEIVQLACRGINNAGSVARCRTISRNGEDVTVVYFCYYKTIWSSIFHGDFSTYRESFIRIDHDIYDQNFDPDTGYHPTKREIYYLPSRELIDADKIYEMSDEEFDALKEQAGLIWSGVV